MEVKHKKICRFCLSKKEPLFDIFKDAREDKEKDKSDGVPIQIMALAMSIEVCK